MSPALMIVGGVVALGLVAKGFSTLFSRPRSSAENNWKNEDFIARERAGSWAESQYHVGGANTAPPSIL